MKIPGYTIVKKIGEGGMASVYLAVQESLGREVALKVMRSARSSENFAERFLKEGRIIAQLQHPQIITIYDFGAQETYNYFSMEFLPGGTLAEQIQQGLSLERAVELTKSIATALAYAHKRGVIHRDIKPQNVLFRHDGTPVLSDFGIAKLVDTDDTQLTVPGFTVGSPVYMSPEQIMGKKLDSRADLYSLGIVLYEMLAKHPPFRAESINSIAMMHCTQPVPRLPAGFSQLQSVLQKLLAKNPKDRFATAEQVIETLDRIGTRSAFVALMDTAQISQSLKSFRPSTGVWIGGLALLALGVSAAVYWTAFRPLPGQAAKVEVVEPVVVPTEQAEIAARQQRADDLLSQARTRRQAGDLASSLNLVEQGLREQPTHTELLALRALIENQSEGQRRIAQLVGQARESIRQEAFTEALQRVEEGLSLDAKQPDLLALRDQAKAASETANRVSGLLRECAASFPPDRLENKRAETILACYRPIMALAPDNPAMRSQLAKIADGYADLASSAIERADFKQAEDYLAQLLPITPNHPRQATLQQALQAKREHVANTVPQLIDDNAQQQRRSVGENRKRPNAEDTKRQAVRNTPGKRAPDGADGRGKPPPAAVLKSELTPTPKTAKPKPYRAEQPRARGPSANCREALLKAQLGEPLSAIEQKECR